jgi:isocitrate dehydrogenase kinase/phosphatase
VNSSATRLQADEELAASAAALIAAAFDAYNEDFGRITRRARRRFRDREWKLGQRDAVERIELYDQRVERCIAGLVGHMGSQVADQRIWGSVRNAFAALINHRADSEFYKTFFNSLTRKIFKTVGVNPGVEFIALDLEPILDAGDPPVRSCLNEGDPDRFADCLLDQLGITGVYEDRAAARTRLLDALGELELKLAHPGSIDKVDILEPVFYRSTRAFLVGRIMAAQWSCPLVLAFKSEPQGIVLDAVITDDGEVNMLFGFSRSYFHVDLPEVSAAVGFLATVMPDKAIGELYTVLGRARQGKTERYRSLFKHLQTSDDQFVHAAGERGMVMIVFALLSWDIVIKVIRDRFAFPKTASRQEVMSKYQLVFKHDRVGRLVDAQEFRQLRFPTDRFEPGLLDDLLSDASQTCRLENGDLIVEHCYIERMLIPLNLYLRRTDPLAARRAVIDYGQAIRDLARTNIFPGDLLAKNFGVSRHGRVIFYDYDELCLVTDCQFRELPRSDHDEDEMRAEPWFHVGPADVFPEQFMDFLGLPTEHRDVFRQCHGEICTADYWREIKACHRAERYLEIVPYSAE